MLDVSKNYSILVYIGKTKQIFEILKNSFCIPATSECKKFKKIIWFECRHHLMVSPPLNQHSYYNKVSFIGPRHLPKFWGKSQKRPLRSLSEPSILSNFSISNRKYYLNVNLLIKYNQILLKLNRISEELSRGYYY